MSIRYNSRMNTPTKYVLGFAFYQDQVLLIRKTRPKWQAGLLNGIGGKVESFDENNQVAMRREFVEETGIETDQDQWHEIGAHIRPTTFDSDSSGYKLVLFACELSEEQVKQLKQTTDEEPVFVNYKLSLNDLLTEGVSGLLMYFGMAINHLANRSFYTVTLEQV